MSKDSLGATMKDKPIPETAEVVEGRLTVMDDNSAPVPTIPQTPMEMVAFALARGDGLEILEKLMDLEDRKDAKDNRRAYYHDMAKANENPPEIIANKFVEFQTSKGKTEYHHADIGVASHDIKKWLAPHGFHLSWDPETPDKAPIKVTCICTHRLGHAEKRTLSAPADSSGGKNSIQSIGSTIRYLERYTALAIVGLAPQDIDDDGILSEQATISVDQVAEIKDLMVGLNKGESRLKTLMGVESIDQIPAGEYTKATGALQQAIKVQNEKAEKAKKQQDRKIQ